MMRIAGNSIICTLELFIISLMLGLFFPASEVIYKGGASSGLGKNIFISSLTLILLYAYLEDLYKNYSKNLEKKSIVYLFLFSPLFVIWISLALYVACLEIVLRYLTLPVASIFYICLCLLLFYFQNRMLINLDVFKNSITEKDN
jgi:hypothetical protein